MALLLNCDLAEGDDPARLAVEERVMPHIHLANIACGYHAGNAEVMRATLALASQNRVRVAAHPGYADREFFGRRSLSLAHEELIRLIHGQLDALGQLAEAARIPVEFVKPHGALYNDMMADARVRASVMEALAHWPDRPTLVMLATPHSDDHREEAARRGLNVAFEAFADRGYGDDGTLLSRTHPGALLRGTAILRQVEQLHRTGTIITASGRTLALAADTLCIHGDHSDSVALAGDIRQLLDGAARRPDSSPP